MHSEDASRIERGMQLAARLPDIMPQQADARIKPLYEDIQQTLRVPFVNLIFRTLANYPDYLEPAWREIRPLVGSRYFEKFADELRRRALLSDSSIASSTLTKAPPDMERLRTFNDTIHYVLPKLLLVAAAWSRNSSEVRDEKSVSPPGLDASSLPYGVAEGTGKVEMVNPEKTDERMQRLFEEIKQRHGHPLVSSYYRGLANWPDMLESVWRTIEPYIGSDEYEARKQSLVSMAEQQLRDWPPLSVKMDSAHAADIAAIIAAFQRKFIPEMLLDAVLIKSAIDGIEAAGTSRFSAAR